MTIALVIRGKFRWSIGQHVVSQHRLQLAIDYDNETSSSFMSCTLYIVKLSTYCRFVLQYVLLNSTLTFLLPGKFQGHCKKYVRLFEFKLSINAYIYPIDIYYSD